MTTDQLDTFAGALANFSLSLYRQIAAESNESSLLVSPLSISLGLAMTYAGAGGNTKLQMKKVLFGDWSAKDDNVHSSFAKVLQLLNEDRNDFEFHLANRIYAHTRQLMPEFTNLLEENYGSDVQLVCFSEGERVRKWINDWVAEKTNCKIKNMIPSDVLTYQSSVVLVNAIYFKAAWDNKFNLEDTSKKEFFSSVDVTKELDTMTKNYRRDFYHEEPEYQLLGISYDGGNLVMFILLPKERFGLQAIEEKLTGQHLLEALKKAELTKMGFVSVPKFKLDTSIDPSNSLCRLGMGGIFDPETADFSKINGNLKLFVSDIYHKASIEISESGTVDTSAVDEENGPSPLLFVADHPFLFTVVDMRTTNVLFLGRFTG